MECETENSDQQAPTVKKMRPSEYEEYDTLVDQLADRLKLARHPDSLVTIKAARLLVENILSTPSTTSSLDDEARAQEEKVKEIRIQRSKFDLDDVILPEALHKNVTSNTNMTSDKKDELKEILERAAKALKLLYLDDQKKLQNRVNEIISSVQSVTANPKTDSKLLTTGR